ncbi:hypothetical protein C0Q70_14646 [Pomacea canaliculata]|uniref:Uncharacterized protein n=1 Tax=Pomacea canaliculata TaxID=400727 RepID=A0A2T7NSP5_POMCA|nr:hypothetical protein C0Q70_14646 [Pomacea canaliculata]
MHSDGDGIPDQLKHLDLDKNGVPDYMQIDTDAMDTDRDGNGIPDFMERDTDDIEEDTDGDGIPDYLDDDANGDGIPDKQQDADGDGIPDYLDDDDNNDGIVDKAGQCTKDNCPPAPKPAVTPTRKKPPRESSSFWTRMTRRLRQMVQAAMHQGKAQDSPPSSPSPNPVVQHPHEETYDLLDLIRTQIFGANDDKSEDEDHPGKTEVNAEISLGPKFSVEGSTMKHNPKGQLKFSSNHRDRNKCAIKQERKSKTASSSTVQGEHQHNKQQDKAQSIIMW